MFMTSTGHHPNFNTGHHPNFGQEDQLQQVEFEDYRPFTKQKINEMSSNFLYSLD